MSTEKIGINYEESTKHSAECLSSPIEIPQQVCKALQDPTNHTAEIQNFLASSSAVK